jgi:hypothetical protein
VLRGHDRQQDRGATHHLVEPVDEVQARLLGQPPGAFRSAVQGGQHGRAAATEDRTEGAAHLTGRDEADDRPWWSHSVTLAEGLTV